MSPTHDFSPEGQVDILMVDDREENLLALEAALESPDFHLVKATSGEQALRYLLDHKPALILLDVQMPKLDGYETAAIVKGSERTRDIPIIFLTALNEEEGFIQKGYQYGAVDYVIKPFNMEILRSKVKVFVDLYQKTQKLLHLERTARTTESRERERRLAELELRSLKREQNHQRRYQDLVQGIDHGIVWAADPASMTFSYIGPTAEQLLGYSPEQWLGETNFWANHIHPADAEAFSERCRKAITEQNGSTGQNGFSMEHRFLTADGRTLWLHTGVRVQAGFDSTNLELRGLSIDITKLKETETSLNRSKQRSDLLAEISLLLANSFDVKETLRSVGQILVPHYADWFAVDLLNENNMQPIALASSVSEIKQEDWAAESLTPMAREELSSLFADGKPKSLRQLSSSEMRLNMMTELPSVAVLPISTQGRSLGTLTIGSRQAALFDNDDFVWLTNLACRIATSLENTRLYEEAQTAIRIRDEFLSIASHELKTPLTPLKLQIQQLLRTLPKTTQANQASVEKLLVMSNRQISRLSKLIEDLLDISRLNRGLLQLELDDFSLTELIKEVTQRFARQLEETNCRVSLDLSDPLTVHWDRLRIEQVVTNLLSNSIKYAPGKPIRLKAGTKKDNVFFSIRDEGIGIAEEDQKRIFQRFERAVSKTHFGGLGLGLYIVSQIVERHEGKVQVKSRPGEGATFLIEIPATGPKGQDVVPQNLLNGQSFKLSSDRRTPRQ